MRGRQLMLAAAACSALAAGCAQKAPEAPAVDLAAEAQAVRDRSAAWLQLAQAKDAAGIANGVFASDLVTMYDGKILKGPAALQADIEAGNAATPNSTISWTTNEIKVAASADLAYELGAFTFDPDGAEAKPATTGEFVTVWSKVDGTWRAVVDAGTMIKAPEAPAQ
ncbi:MAG: nuclear transport factor 2 family protein [Steroidobacteraceae bacterium]